VEFDRLDPGMARGLLCLALLLAVPGTSAPVTAPSAVDWVAAGDAALGRLDLEGAAAAFRRAHEAAPDSYDAAWKLARALTDEATLSNDAAVQKRLCAEAERLARHATRLDPVDSRGHDYLAISLGKLALTEGGKRKVELSKEVKAEAEWALRCNPDDDLALHVLAVWNREMADLNWVLRKLAGVLYGKLPPASIDTAIANLTRATVLRPEVIPHRVELGVTLAAARRWAEARVELEKGLALPTGWVTDDHYRALARATLLQVQAHLR